MYRKIRCDVRQWKILETFRGTKHSLSNWLKISAAETDEGGLFWDEAIWNRCPERKWEVNRGLEYARSHMQHSEDFFLD